MLQRSNETWRHCKLALLQTLNRSPSCIASNDRIQNSSPSPVFHTELHRTGNSLSSLLAFLASGAGYNSIDQIASAYGIESG
jgi:hypothetical protein